MSKQVECPDCEGMGLLEDRKGNEYACPSCKGKGTINEKEDEKTHSSSTNTPTGKCNSIP